MSAPGIQLGSGTQLTVFEPSVRQYLQQIEQAVVSENLTAARQAFSQLEKGVRALASSSRTTATSSSHRSVEELHNLGAALESGDLTAAGQAVNELRQSFSAHVPSDSESRSDQASSSSSNPTSTEESGDNGGSESSRNLNVRV